MTNQLGELLEEQTDYKWITAPDQHGDHPGQTLLTRDRRVIRAWAEVRDAEPATGVGKVEINDGGAAIRFAFPGVGRLQPISWDAWFRNFDEYELVFVYEERTAEGLQSHKYRLVRRGHLPQYLADVGPPHAASHIAEKQAVAPSQAEAGASSRRSRRWRRALNLFRPRGSSRR